MIIAIVQIIVGLLGLTFGADRFVDGASGIARQLNVSPLLIGLTIVAFGTSAPEMIVSATAALNGNPGIALGNAVGSNIANVGLVLGATALVLPLMVQSKTLRREFILLWIIMIATFFMLYDLVLSRVEAVIMLIGLFSFMAWLIIDGKRAAKDNPPDTDEDYMSTGKSIFWTIFGLAILVIGGYYLVKGGVELAKLFNVSDAVIGLTIIAIGTSLPELAASMAGALKGQPDIAVGNVIGSNVFNLLGVIGIAGVIKPMEITEEFLKRDYIIMLMITALLFAFCLWRVRGGKLESELNRTQGAVLLTLFIGYQVFIAFIAK